MGNKRVRNDKARYTPRCQIGLPQADKEALGTQAARKNFEATRDGYFVWRSEPRRETTRCS